MNGREPPELFCANRAHGKHGKRLMVACTRDFLGRPICEFCAEEEAEARKRGEARMQRVANRFEIQRRAAE